MKKMVTTKIKNSISLKESWVIFFLLGIIMMNFPFLTIFNKNIFLFGVPLLCLYFYGGWVISIAIIYIFSRISAGNHHQSPPQSRT